MVDPLEDTKMLLDSYLDDFSLDAAIGKQLDTIGTLVNSSRILPFAPLSASRILSDDDYRLLIRSKIALRKWDGTTEMAMDLFQIIFPDFGFVLVDNQNSSFTVKITTASKVGDLQLEMLNAGLLLPRPAGVGVNVEVPQVIQTSNIIIQSGIYELGQMDIKQSASI